MPRPTTLFQYNYDTLLKVTGEAVTINDIYQHRTRDNFDPENFESVLVWCARHARPDLKERIIRNVFDSSPIKASLPREESSKPAKKAPKKPSVKKNQASK